MRLFIHVIAISIVAVSPWTARADYALDAGTAELVDCGVVMAYAGNYALMTNNERQARVYFYQHARATVALFAKNYVNGVVSGERTAAWEARAPAAKYYLDKHQANLFIIVNRCYPIIQQAVNEPIVRYSRMWGKDFTEMVELMAAKTRSQYGLR